MSWNILSNINHFCVWWVERIAESNNRFWVFHFHYQLRNVEVEDFSCCVHKFVQFVFNQKVRSE